MSALEVGFVGLGRMGVPMARRLEGAGLLRGVYNRTHSKAVDLAGQLGVEAFKTPAALAAACDVIVTMLADEQAVRQVHEGLVAALRPGTVAVEMSTIGPAPLPDLASALSAAGCSLLDAPVSGSIALAASGRLTLMVGGEEADFERVRPVLSTLGGTVIHLGPLGSGAIMKLAVNTIIYGLNEAVAEALVLAESAGVQRQLAYEVFASSAVAAPFVHYRRQAFEHPESVPAAFRLALASKDMRLALALSATLGTSLPQTEVNLRVAGEALSAGFSEHDVTAVAEHLRRKQAVMSRPPIPVQTESSAA